MLDLFAGVGSFGIECLSQGARHVTFVEKYQGVLPILKNNLNNLRSEINYEIIEMDILDKLEFKNLKFRYDIIFLDPPYKEKALETILKNLIENKVLKKSGILLFIDIKKKLMSFQKILS